MATGALARRLNESEMGNNPGALIRLSLTREMKMSKSEAAAELQRIMKSPEYLKGDKQTVLQVKVLSRIAYAGTEERATVADTRQRVQSQSDSTKASLRQEAAELIKRDYRSETHSGKVEDAGSAHGSETGPRSNLKKK